MTDGVVGEQALQGTLVVAEARSSFERETIAAWAATRYPGATVTELPGTDLDQLPAHTRLIPVRVVWLPPVRNGERRVSAADVVALTNPRRPRPITQRWIGKRS
ncbi:MAG: hypothetical protein ABWZ26_08655, partial [Candidatus Nanopelagicales bacterium]